MGSEGLLGELEGLLGVLDATCFKVLEDSLLIGGDSTNFCDDLSDEFDSLSDPSLRGSRSHLFGLHVKLGDGVPLVLADGDHSWVTFSHMIRYNITTIYLIFFHRPSNKYNPPPPSRIHQQNNHLGLTRKHIGLLL